MTIPKAKVEGWGDYDSSHFMLRADKLEWMKHVIDGGAEGYHWSYKSLCGVAYFVRQKKDAEKFLKTLPTKKRPCLRCLLLLARREGLV